MKVHRSRRNRLLCTAAILALLVVPSFSCNQRKHGNNRAPQPTPAIVTITPDKGVVGLFSMVQIDTTSFVDDFTVNAPTVTFDSSPATIAQALSSSAIVVWSPPALTPAVVDVTVQSTSFVQQASRPNGFEYVAVPGGGCTILGVNPPAGPLWGGTDVTITGSGFTPGAQVFFDVFAGSNVIFDSPGQIRVATPPGQSPTLVDVTVADPVSGVGCTLPLSFSYLTVPPPLPCTITSICPDQGDTAGGDLVVIQGADFESLPRVFFGGVESPNVTFDSPNQVTAETPALATGGVAVDVLVENPTPGSDCTLPAGFVYRISNPTPDPLKEPQDDVRVTCNSVINNPIIFQSNIHDNGDVDFYCFTMLSAPDRTVTLRPDPVLDPNLDLWLLDAGGVVIDTSANPSGPESVTTPGQGTFAVQVFAECGDVGAYEIEFSDGW